MSWSEKLIWIGSITVMSSILYAAYQLHWAFGNAIIGGTIIMLAVFYQKGGTDAGGKS